MIYTKSTLRSQIKKYSQISKIPIRSKVALHLKMLKYQLIVLPYIVQDRPKLLQHHIFLSNIHPRYSAVAVTVALMIAKRIPKYRFLILWYLMHYKPKLLQLPLPGSTHLRYPAVVAIAAHLTVKRFMIVVTGNRVTRKLLTEKNPTMKQNIVGSPCR